jgi:hypothetical protein
MPQLADFKSQVIVRQLVDLLNLRVGSTLGVVQSTDTNGNPTILVGAGTAGSQSAFIRIQPLASVGLDGFAQLQQSYGPHQAQTVLETSTIAGVSLVTEANKLLIIGTILGFGCHFELYLTANTVAVTVAGITGQPVAIIDSTTYPFMITT